MEPPSEPANGALAPRANPSLVGHETVERELRRLHESSRSPHAILFSGPRGIGKATLAFRFARFVLAGSRVKPGDASGLAVDPASEAFHRVAAGGHADLLTVERIWDPRRRRLHAEIMAEHTREIAGFLHLTAAEDGWRVVIIDGAEEMNSNAANALLKILEEPPPSSLLLLVSHNPGMLLPTIRSRCRRFRLAALSPPLLSSLIERYRPTLDKAEAATLCSLACGSIGRALELADAGGAALYRSVLEILSQIPRLDVRRLHSFADALAATDAESAYRTVGELLLQCLAQVASAGGRGRRIEVNGGEGEAMQRLAARAEPARWAGLREQIERNFTATRDLNLDRKEAMLGAFFAIAEAAR